MHVHVQHDPEVVILPNPSFSSTASCVASGASFLQLLCIPTGPGSRLHELNYRAKKSLSGIEIQEIDGAMETLKLPVVFGPVHMSIGVVKPACCFQVSSPVSGQLLREINDSSLTGAASNLTRLPNESTYYWRQQY